MSSLAVNRNTQKQKVSLRQGNTNQTVNLIIHDFKTKRKKPRKRKTKPKLSASASASQQVPTPFYIFRDRPDFRLPEALRQRNPVSEDNSLLLNTIQRVNQLESFKRTASVQTVPLRDIANNVPEINEPIKIKEDPPLADTSLAAGLVRESIREFNRKATEPSINPLTTPIKKSPVKKNKQTYKGDDLTVEQLQRLISSRGLTFKKKLNRPALILILENDDLNRQMDSSTLADSDEL